MPDILNKLYDRSLRTYYLTMVKIIESDHHLSYVARQCPFPDIRKMIWVKSGNEVGEGAYINHSITILSSPDLKPNVKLGKRVALSPNIVFICYSSPNNSLLGSWEYSKQYIRKGPIEVGDDTWIGAGVIIQPGINIGARCIIGSMSNVTKDIPDDYIAFGNPIRLVRKLRE